MSRDTALVGVVSEATAAAPVNTKSRRGGGTMESPTQAHLTTNHTQGREVDGGRRR